jgi:glycosyltransferase involved in cell wall biosynthesis
LYQPRSPRDDGGPPIVGWSGSFSTVQHLEHARPALERLARDRRFRLRVVGGDGVTMAGIDVECRPWRADTEVGDIASFDVGLMPLPDDPWARGKCGLKALQYMALGIPAVVSPVGVNAEIVEHGRNGLVASSQEDWVTSVGRLLDDIELRRQLGAAARLTVEQRYSASVVAPQVARIFAETAAPSRGRTDHQP